ncbi:MAG: hypothetical protein Ta2D_13090 [Rickettsiales bacterium]|nr:MAG: hypothetical protein Ta2D_13090 [Rickettsiales bacterium]
MNIFTIGFTQKTAKDFFEILKKNKIECLIDIRLNNVSQLAGFAKGNDLNYFLKEICNIDYKHEINFAPTKEILEDYRNKKTSWNDYERDFNQLLINRKVENIFENYNNYNNLCFLCSEPTAKQCHRRLLAEYLKSKKQDIKIIHI